MRLCLIALNGIYPRFFQQIDCQVETGALRPPGRRRQNTIHVTLRLAGRLDRKAKIPAVMV